MIIWQERVIAEKHELDNRISKLKHFNDSSQFDEIPPGEMIRLRSQLVIMTEYSDILQNRINNFRED